MRHRTLAAAAVAVAVALSLASAGPSLAKEGVDQGRSNQDKSAERAGSPRPAKARVEGREEASARKAEAQARRKARFVAVGIVTEASATSITLMVKGGSAKGLRGKTQVIAIGDGASVSRNGQPATGANVIVPGDHAKVKGTRAGEGDAAVYTAHKVRAQSRSGPTT